MLEKGEPRDMLIGQVSLLHHALAHHEPGSHAVQSCGAAMRSSHTGQHAEQHAAHLTAHHAEQCVILHTVQRVQHAVNDISG